MAAVCIGSEGIFSCEALQFRLGYGELSCATIEADHELWKHPHNRLVQAMETWEMNSEFSEKFALIFRLARPASHFNCLSRYA